MVRHHIQCEEYTEAIKVLMGIKRGVSQLYYDFSPVLMRHAPRETVEAWMSRKMKLDPVKLIPALVQYNLSQERMEVSMITACDNHVTYVRTCDLHVTCM